MTQLRATDCFWGRRENMNTSTAQTYNYKACVKQQSQINQKDTKKYPTWMLNLNILVWHIQLLVFLFSSI